MSGVTTLLLTFYFEANNVTACTGTLMLRAAISSVNWYKKLCTLKQIAF